MPANADANKNGFLLPIKCLEGLLKYLVSIILNFKLFAEFYRQVCDFYKHYIKWRIKGF